MTKKKTPRTPAKTSAPAGEAPANPANVPFGSLDLYERATEEIYRRDYGDLVQIRSGQREFLSLRLGSERYAVELNGILEVTRPGAITPVPFSPNWIVGVMLLRGSVVPVFHVGRMLGLSGEEHDLEPAERVLIVRRTQDDEDAAESVVGLLVDEVHDVLAVPEEDLGPVPATVHGPRAEYVKGVARKGNVILGILHHARLARAKPEART